MSAVSDTNLVAIHPNSSKLTSEGALGSSCYDFSPPYNDIDKGKVREEEQNEALGYPKGKSFKKRITIINSVEKSCSKIFNTSSQTFLKIFVYLL